MPRVFVAHPERAVVRRFLIALRARRHSVASTTEMEGAIRLLVPFNPDLAVVGHRRAGETLSWLAELRDLRRTPVIAIAECADPGVFAAAGISQVVPPDVLRRPLARAVSSVLAAARAERRLRLHPTYWVGGDAFGSLVRLVQVRGRVRFLSATENAIFRLLMESRGNVVRYDQLAKAAWPLEATDLVPRSRVRVHVHNIRRRLAEFGPEGPRIELSIQNGYRLVWPEPSVTDAPAATRLAA